MSEERERMELSEAALEGISGGSNDPYEQSRSLCRSCHEGIIRGYHRCGGGPDELYHYLEKHRKENIQGYPYCPFYLRGKGE